MSAQLATGRWIAVGVAVVGLAAFGTMAHLNAQVQTGGTSAGAVSGGMGTADQQSQADIGSLRRDLDLATQQVLEARARLNQIMFERIKSIKKRQGLTPNQAKAFDAAYAVELDKVNRAQRQIDSARKRIIAREQAIAARSAPSQTGTRPDAYANILARLESLERRVAVLEMSVKD